MACPTFEHFMLPMLRLLSNGQQLHWRAMIDPLADALELSLEDRSELIASGKEPRLVNRVYWAKTNLKQAGLIAFPTRGTVQIAKAGLDLLVDPPGMLDVQYLRRYAEYSDFIGRIGSRSASTTEVEAGAEAPRQTPVELIDSGYTQIRREVASELLESVRRMSPRDFEQLVVELLVRLGYGGSFPEAAKAVGGSGDGGIDGIIKEDRLGLDAIYIQAKRYAADNHVGDAEVRNFLGSLVARHARKGVFVTTSSFRPKARDLAVRGEHKIVLIDGNALAELMIDCGIGVSTVATYVIPKLDTDYFER